MPESNADATLIELAAEIVSAYVSRNSVPTAELPGIIQSVYKSLGGLSGKAEPQPEEAPLKPAVSIKRSITDEAIVCLEDGQRFKSLKRHLASAHGMTPQEYRAKWGLAKDYPMVAPAYANQRSTLARSLGLGRKKAVSAEVPPLGRPEPAPEPTKAPPRRKATATATA